MKAFVAIIKSRWYSTQKYSTVCDIYTSLCFYSPLPLAPKEESLYGLCRSVVVLEGLIKLCSEALGKSV